MELSTSKSDLHKVKALDSPKYPPNLSDKYFIHYTLYFFYERIGFLRSNVYIKLKQFNTFC